jgi:glycogen debranching enzyme
LFLSLRRRIDGVLHDDLAIQSFAPRSVYVRLTVQIDADFSDIFEVKAQSLPPRLGVQRVPHASGITYTYERAGFRRALRVSFTTEQVRPLFAGPIAMFELHLEPGAEWYCCLEAVPIIDGTPLVMSSDPHGSAPSPGTQEGASVRTDPILQRPFERGRADLHSLAVAQPDAPPYVAAGVPWFLTLFGRDPLVTALMAGITGAWSAEGALAALGKLQATARDDWRDAEPGKIPHEIRHGELARMGQIPHTPYYGTHDASSLYCLALWHAWRWTGVRRLLDAHLPTARAALHWCEAFGDRDGDGLQEYATRSRLGYYNQGWKDAGDAIVDTGGQIASLPLATVELQGNLFAAYLAIAELLEVVGEIEEAKRLRSAAALLRQEVERRYWLEEEGYYALALDGEKRLVATIASNPSHLLWYGLPSPERAARVADRLLRPDLYSGWGLRTLSADHQSYNPLSYQRGSVWPHDTAIAAAGLWRYGHREAASQLLRGLLEAANCFEDERLPELFCGFPRTDGPPVPYDEANSPQAWAAAAPILAVQLFIGLQPDAPRGRCFIDPWLPTWLNDLDVNGVAVGPGVVNIRLRREGTVTVVDELDTSGLAVVRGTPPATLLGAPLPTG